MGYKKQGFILIESEEPDQIYSKNLIEQNLNRSGKPEFNVTTISEMSEEDSSSNNRNSNIESVRSSLFL